MQLYVQVKEVVTVVSLTAPPKSTGQPEQVTLVPEREQAAHPVGQGRRETEVLTLDE
jgi:hypothetical protein